MKLILVSSGLKRTPDTLIHRHIFTGPGVA